MNQPTTPLSQLQCYLAFGLTGTFPHLNDGFVYKVERMGLFQSEFITIETRYNTKTYNANVEYFKPLVIPLTSLTDQQWVEVFKAGMPFEIKDNEGFHIDHGIEFITVKYQQWTTSISMCYCIKFHEFELFGSLTAFNQLADFQKLFELHADVWGWVEAGLALNKLEVGK